MNRPSNLRAVSLLLPEHSDAAREYIDQLEQLVSPCLASNEALFPTIAIKRTGASSGPALIFSFDDDVTLALAGPAQPGSGNTSHKVDDHALIAADSRARCLPLTDVQAALQPHITGLNHVGLNLPGRSASEWQSLEQRLGRESFTFAFPSPQSDGSRIHFILPATEEEFGADFLDLDLAQRQPMLELVDDKVLRQPCVHFNIETDLDRDALCNLFPGENSVFKPGDEDFFLSVCSQAPWEGLTIYFDVSFARAGPPIDIPSIMVNHGRRL